MAPEQSWAHGDGDRRMHEGGGLAAAAHPGLSGVEMLLHDVALSVAFQITPRNPQYVIKRLLPNDCYKIVSGVPSFSERHGIGEVGSLYTPVPKRALLDAIERNEIVAIDDAPNDEAVTCYMAGHIAHKSIQSVAIVPIGIDAVRWLIVLDKVPPSRRGFSRAERAQLEACKRSTERGLLHLSEQVAEANHGILQRALQEYAHLLRNPLTVIGGFANKLKRTRDPERIEHYAEIIYSQSRRLEDEFGSFISLVGFLFPTDDQPVPEVLARVLDSFAGDPKYEVSAAPEVGAERVLVVPEALQALLTEMRAYLRGSSGADEVVRLEAQRSQTHAALVFWSSAFQEFKAEQDLRLAIFRQVAYQLDGDCRVGKGWCRVSLPLAERRLL